MSFAAARLRMDRAMHRFLGGVPVIYQPPSGPAVEVVGMFDENFVPLQPGESRLEQAGPFVKLVLADLPGDPFVDKAEVTIKGIIYKARARERDGDPGGGVVLRLHKIGIAP